VNGTTVIEAVEGTTTYVSSVLETVVCQNTAVARVVNEMMIFNGLSRNVMHGAGTIQSVKSVPRHGTCGNLPLI
jgi:hypothetical protein